MQIFHRLTSGSPMRGSARTNQTTNVPTVTFGLDGKYELRDVRVVLGAELATSKHARPIWHLVSDSNSIPVRGFNYGQRIRGMRPEVKGARPGPLESNVTYRLLVEAVGRKGHYGFKFGGKN